MIKSNFYIWGLKRKYFLLFFISGILFVQSASAQWEISVIAKVEMHNGNIHIGNVLYEDDAILKLSTQILGEITINKKDIKEISEINKKNRRLGRYWSENPLCDRYLIAPSAFNLERGQLYYQNNMIVGNQINLGVTDNISAEAGLVGFQDAGSGEVTYWARVKYKIPLKSEKFHLGAGAFYASILNESDRFFRVFVRNEGYHLYSVGTYGNKMNNVSLAMSYGNWDGEWQSRPTVNLSGKFQVFVSTSFLFEYYVFLPFQANRFGFVGMRTDWKKVSLNYGIGSLNRNTSGRDFTLDTVPWFGLTIRFGNAWR